MANKTNIGLVAYAKAQIGLPYWYGCFGQTATKSLHDSKKKQYPKYYDASKYKIGWSHQYGKRVHDCVGLIKGYLWSDSATSKPIYKSSQDVSANGMLAKCKKKGKIKTIPEVVGVLVFFDGHVGVYEGNGYVIEARGHDYGVVRTKLSARPWTDWGECPYITYVETTKPTISTTPTPTPSSTSLKFKVGDIVNFAGGKHYSSAVATNGSTVKASRAKVTAISKTGKHSYHVRAVNDKGVFIDGVYGWVDASTVSAVKSASTTTANKPTSNPAQKSLDDWAKEVINGKHGNGMLKRTSSLKKAGCPYSYAKVRARVNALLKKK